MCADRGPLAAAKAAEVSSAGEGSGAPEVDRQAFAAAFDRLQPGLRRYFARRLGGDAEGADELCQRTWLIVWDAFRSGRYEASRASLSTFAYSVAYKVWLRGGRRPPTPTTSHAEMDGFADRLLGDGGDTPSDALAMAELLTALQECVAARDGRGALTDAERQLVQAVAAGGTDRSIAATLGVSASTVNARKHAAYDKLRRCLASKGFGSADRRAHGAAGGIS